MEVYQCELFRKGHFWIKKVLKTEILHECIRSFDNENNGIQSVEIEIFDNWYWENYFIVNIFEKDKFSKKYIGEIWW